MNHQSTDTHHTGVVIPEHLRYKEPSVKNHFQYIESRYKSPKKHIDPIQYHQQHSPPRATTPRNERMAHIEPRYTSPPKPKVLNRTFEPLDRTESLHPTPEYLKHKQQSKALGFGQIP